MDRLHRDAQSLRRFLQAQPGEIAVLDHPAPAGVRGREAVEREIERQQLLRLLGGQEALGLVERQSVRSGASLVALAAAGVVDQQAPHGAGGDGEKAAAVLGRDPPLVEQAQIHLVDQRRGAQGVVRPLAAERPPCHLAQLAVDQGDDPVERLAVPVAPAFQPLGHFATHGGSGSSWSTG